VTASFFAALISAQGSGASARDKAPDAGDADSPALFVSQPVIQPLPAANASDAAAQDAQQDAAADLDEPATLAELVAEQPRDETISPELRCLAGAVYFEAKSESLAGQLAVGRVVVNRSKSGRFPDSYCGVVFQPSQFSFVRGRSMPHINTNSRDWREAVAIARIADADAWKSKVEGALFFHATRVSPGWRLTRIARIDNHIFYR
jgi:spore germination cell wall hydrolase CwlJ-like protein